MTNWNRKGVDEYSGTEGIQMVRTRGENGPVPYGRRVLMAEVNGDRVRGRTSFFMDDVKVALCNRGMTVARSLA